MRAAWRRIAPAWGVVALWLVGAPLLLACSVPVFRYALERWPADPYRVLLVHDGPLADTDKAVAAWLTKCASPEDAIPSIVFHTVDLAAPPDAEANAEAIKELRAKIEGRELPLLLVHYPMTSRNPTEVWSGRLNATDAKALLDSPLRRDVAKRLLGGDTAVWLLLESGKKAKDDAAQRLLEAELKKVEKALKLPDMRGDPVAQRMFGDEAPSLRIGFSVVRLSRTDAAERMLVRMLLGTEEDLAGLKEPIVFPIFGRGRALYALVGPGINAENIQETCFFLAGPCACQIKTMNPGSDLLMMVDWDAALYGQITSAPALTGLPELVLPSPPKPQAEPTEEPPPAEQPATKQAAGALVRNIVVAVVVGLALLAAAAFVFARRSNGVRS